MSTKLGTVLADFTTNLATAIIVGGTTATLQSATDDDGVALPSGRYFFTLDGSSSNKEHMSCDLVGTTLTNIKSVSRQGVESVGLVRAHRIGCTVSLTDFAHLLYINNLVAGTTLFNSLVKLGYDADPSITSSDLNYFATVRFVNSIAVAGAPNASTTVKGIVQMATLAQLLAKTATGSTGAVLSVSPDILPGTQVYDYKADTGTANTYAIAPAPAITAYAVGQEFSFKALNTNTGASTLNVNTISAKTIKKGAGTTDLVAGDIVAGMIVQVKYDGVNMVMVNPVAPVPATQAAFAALTALSSVAGEALTGATTPQPIALINDIFQQTFGGSPTIAVGKVTTGNKAAISFTPQGAVTLTQLKLYLKKNSSPTDNFVVEIQSDTAGAPSGTPLTNGVATGIAGTGLTSSFVLTTITFPGTVTLVPNTKYWIVFHRDSTASDTNFYLLDGDVTANIYASFSGSTFNASSWSGGADMPYFQIVAATGFSLSAWRVKTNHASYYMRFVAGVSNQTVSAGAAISLYSFGIVGGFTGLVPNARYYAQDTIGTLGITPGTTEAIVGIANSPTSLLTDLSAGRPQFLSSAAAAASVAVPPNARIAIADLSGTSASGTMAVEGEITLSPIGKTGGTATVQSTNSGGGSVASVSVSASWSGNTVSCSLSGSGTLGAIGGTVYFYY